MTGWDYIVVGAGSTGAVLAGRLSENPQARVLLLEAGDDYRRDDAPPEMLRGHWTGILDLDRFPQFQWRELTARRAPGAPFLPYWRGRGVGGSSAINGQVAIRPPLADFDAWTCDDVGLWSHDRVLAAFNRLEDDLWYGDASYHGVGGPIPISRAGLDDWGALDQAFRGAVMSAGLPWAPDSNAPGANGISIYAYNARDEARVSTNDGYLDPARERSNLEIRGGHLVDRVVFDGTRATGVVAITAKGRVRLDADQVILSAGAIHSPAILLRSGVGPADQLAALGIPTVVTAPVGLGFQEHPHVYFGFPVSPSLPAPANGRHTNACIRWSSGQVGIDQDMMGMVNGPAPGLPDFAGLGLFVNRPFSRGSVRLASVDPTVDPVIEMELATDERDLSRLVYCVEMAREFLGSAEMADVIQGKPTGIDGTALDDFREPGEVAQWVRQVVDGSAHASCTCPIGRPEDGGVVDERGRVHGATGLSVLDMSISPWVPRANTNLTAIMIGELVAASI